MTKKLKVLYISPNGFIGGAENFVLDCVAGHMQYGKVDAQVLFFNNGRAVEIAKERKISHYVLPKTFRFRRPIALIWAILHIRKKIKEIGPDVIHLTMFYSHLVIFFASLGLKIKRIWFQHGPVGRPDILAKLFPCDLIMFVSKYMQEAHNKLIGPSWNIPQKVINTIVWYYKAKEEKVTEIRWRFLKENDALLIGTVGRVTEWKGLHIFIKAISLLQKKLEQHAFEKLHFIIIGRPNMKKDEEYLKRLKEMVIDLGLQSKITFLGFVDEIENFYQAIDIFVHSAIIPEPFGATIAEAMLHHSLVVGSNKGGVLNILKDGETGYSFDPTVIDSSSQLELILQDKINKMIVSKDDQTINSIIIKGRKLIEDDYSAQNIIPKLEEIYQNIL